MDLADERISARVKVVSAFSYRPWPRATRSPRWARDEAGRPRAAMEDLPISAEGPRTGTTRRDNLRERRAVMQKRDDRPASAALVSSAGLEHPLPPRTWTRVAVRPQAYFRLISDKELTRAQPAPTSGQGALEGLLPRLKLRAALHSCYGSTQSRTSDPCRTALLSGEGRPNPVPASG
eukprot:scaffold38504_cov111-Phaeocystis_antarctica.AAC.4